MCTRKLPTLRSGLLTEMARAAALANDPDVPDVGPPLKALYAFTTDEVEACVTTPEIYEALKPACLVLTSAVAFERARRAKTLPADDRPHPPGSNLADHLRRHIDYIRTIVSPEFKNDRWVKWSAMRMAEMIGSGKPFSTHVHDAFFITMESQDLQQIGDKRPSTEPEYRAPRPVPSAPRAHRPDSYQPSQRPTFFAPTNPSNAPWHAAPYPQGNFPATSMPAPMPPSFAPPFAPNFMPPANTSYWYGTQQPAPPQFPQAHQQQMPQRQVQHQQPQMQHQQPQPQHVSALGPNSIAVPAGHGQYSFQPKRDAPPPVCTGLSCLPYLQGLYGPPLTATATTSLRARSKTPPVSFILSSPNDPSRRICVYHNIYGTCHGHKGDQLHVLQHLRLLGA
ncbi:hypothetical protein R3P38DRAFT_2767126 [Favolaschia claudopus]|uniref:Uncharacterized protein n=1 Tax=Favolaschia claudopus TaxID=2862362 RepID=A0AAW0CY36_9AGAR